MQIQSVGFRVAKELKSSQIVFLPVAGFVRLKHVQSTTCNAKPVVRLHYIEGRETPVELSIDPKALIEVFEPCNPQTP